MKSEKSLDDLLRPALQKETEQIEAHNEHLSKIKERLRNAEKNKTSYLRQRCETLLWQLRFSLNVPVVIGCWIVIGALLLCTFVQPVRAIAKEGLSKIFTSIYIAVKGEDGKYEAKAIKIPKNKITTASQVARHIPQDDKSLSKMAGFNAAAPRTLAGRFKFNYSSICQVQGKSWREVGKFYKHGSTLIILNITTNDYFIKDARKSGDNRKEIVLGKITGYYAESPFPEYPTKMENGELVDDLSKKPIRIKVLHSLNWKQHGLYYRVWDLKGNITVAELKGAALDMISYLNKVKVSD